MQTDMQARSQRPDFRQSDADSVKQLFDDSFCAMEYGFTSDRAPWGISRFQSVNLGGVGVFFDEGYGRRSVTRTRRHILDDSLADFLVVIPLHIQSSMTQSGAARNCEPGYFRVLSTAIPFTGYVAATDARDKYSELLAKIPGAMLRELVPRIDEMSNIPLPLRRGAGFLMKSFFDLALVEGEALTEAQSQEFSATIVRAVAAAVIDSSEYQRLSAAPRPTASARVRAKACEFILRNLANPGLDCALVAEYCQVSQRYLHVVFADNGAAATSETVSEFIRESRLQKCRAALHDASLARHTVEEIASGWGFANPASFNRIYKARFGVTPGVDRRSIVA